MESEFKKLTDREHMLLRPAMYIGKTAPEACVRFINGHPEEVTISAGLMKIVNELIDNSIDEFIRSEGKAATKISIDISESSVTVTDNGRGIPVEKYQKEWRPQVAWTEAKAGTSFAENRVGPGANGVGSVVANVFSKEFKGITQDGAHKCTVYCTNNMQTVKTSITKSDKHGTQVTIIPDFNRFDLTCFTEDHIKVLEDRIRLLAITYPEISFKFNKDNIKYRNSNQYFETYGSPFVSFSGEHFTAAFYPSEGDEYIQRSSIDGLDLVMGGTHETILARDLCYALKDLIKKKHKLELSPAEIKHGLKLVFIGRDFPNMDFDSQTKERLTNSEKVTKEWLGEYDIQKLAKKVFNTKEILEPIIEAKLAKQIAAEKRAVALALKKQSKKHIEKHLEAKSRNKEERILFLVEGDSAAGSGIKVRNPQIHGFFPMRGMPMNTYGATEKAMLDNQEIANIIAILNLKFGMTDKEISDNIEYGRIGILCDGDTDGAGGLSPMLLNFLYHWKALFDQKRVYIIPSPRYVLTKGKGAKRQVVYFYDTETYEAEHSKYKGYETRYIKGLATLRDYEYAEVLNNESKWIQVKIDDPECFKIMYSDNVEARKELMS